MKRVLVALLAAFWLVGITVLPASPASAAIPELPHAFFGTLTINGAPAPVGTTVEARGTGVLTGIVGNPVITTLQGVYGGAASFDPKLVVQGTIVEGTIISFLVNGNTATQTATWLSGHVTSLDLTVITGGGSGGGTSGGIVGVGGSGTTGGGGVTGTGNVNLTGLKADSPLNVDTSGKVQSTVTLQSTSGKPSFDLNIPAGTVMKTTAGVPLIAITVTVPATPPPPPPENTIILTQDFGPDGATFSPSIVLSFKFDPAKLPAGVTESNLTVAYWNGSVWITVPATIDPVAKVITAQVTHFTVFAVMGKQVSPADGASILAPSPALVTVPEILPAPTPETEAPEPAPAPAVSELSPAPDPSPAPTPAPSPQAQPETTNLWIFGGMAVAAVIIIGWLIFILRKRAV